MKDSELRLGCNNGSLLAIITKLENVGLLVCSRPDSAAECVSVMDIFSGICAEGDFTGVLLNIVKMFTSSPVELSSSGCIDGFCDIINKL
jgi:hypothetical protein